MAVPVRREIKNERVRQDVKEKECKRDPVGITGRTFGGKKCDEGGLIWLW